MSAQHAARIQTPAVDERHTKTAKGEIKYVRFLAICASLGLLVQLLIRLWQEAWWFPIGMDATTPEFATYWMGLLYTEFGILTLVGLLGWLAYRNPCGVCETQRHEHGHVLAQHEIGHIGKLWATVAIAAMFGFGVSYFAEQDASWHQIVVRDTAFTPSHIPLFFFTFPMLIILTGLSSWYAYKRLHYLYVGEDGTGIPLSYLLFPAGAWLLVANVAFNELGHSSWITEELFVQPYHFPFAWATYFFFAGFALLFVTVPHIFKNLKAIAEETSKQELQELSEESSARV